MLLRSLPRQPEGVVLGPLVGMRRSAGVGLVKQSALPLVVIVPLLKLLVVSRAEAPEEPDPIALDGTAQRQRKVVVLLEAADLLGAQVAGH